MGQQIVGRFGTAQHIVWRDDNTGAYIGAGECAGLCETHIIGADHPRQTAARHAGYGGRVIHLVSASLAVDGQCFGGDVGGEAGGLGDQVIACGCSSQAVRQIHCDIGASIGTCEGTRRRQTDIACVHGQHALNHAIGYRGRGCTVIHLVIHRGIGHGDRQRIHRVVGRHITELVIAGVAAGHCGCAGCDAETAGLRHAGFVGGLRDTSHCIGAHQGGV